MYPTFTCKSEEEVASYEPLPKAGDILEHEDGERTLVRYLTRKNVEHWHGCGCCRGKTHHEFYVLIDGEPAESKGSYGTVDFIPTLECHYEWPPKNHKLIRDGVVIYDGTT